MLAAMNSPQNNIPLREHSHLDIQHDSRDTFTDNIAIDERLCPGCKKSAVSEQGGLVVAFGQSFFHVDCFKCAKCGDQVTADTNLLLLSDGSPICANCSYSCNVCHLPILDEAIMTGDDSYHAHCFKCKVCKNRIDELVFAKTSQGIYCMNCHNERMIKIRKHTQKKAEREKAAGGSGSSKSRDQASRHHHRDNGGPNELNTRPGSSKANGAEFDTRDIGALPLRSPGRRRSGPIDAFNSSDHSQTYPAHGKLPGSPLPSPPIVSRPPHSLSVNVAPPPEAHRSSTLPASPTSRSDKTIGIQPPTPARNSTLPIPPGAETGPDGRRRSYDDGVRPLNVLFQKSDNGEGSAQVDSPPSFATPPSDGLALPTSRRDKRRSINPGLVLADFNAAVSPPAMSPSLSPLSASFNSHKSINNYHTPLTSGRQSSRPPSPLAYYRTPSSSRPTSHASSLDSFSSLRSSSSSPVPPEKETWGPRGATSRSRSPSFNTLDNQDQTIVMRPPPHPSATLDTDASPVDSPPDSGGPRSLSPSVIRPQRSFDDRSRPGSSGHRFSSVPSLDSDRRRSLAGSRSNSPAYRADVPHSVESGTDSEVEPDGENQGLQGDLPPALPPKEEKDLPPRLELAHSISSATEAEADTSIMSLADTSMEDLSESSPVEHTSHATFIAPALPPIRFSMNTADFSELFSSVGGLPSLKSLDYLARLSEQDTEHTITLSPVPSSPPTTSANINPLTDTVSPPSKAIEIINGKDLDSIASPPGSDDRNESPTAAPSELSQDEPRTPATVFSRPKPGRQPSSVLVETKNPTLITLTEPGSSNPTTLRRDTPDIVVSRLQEAVSDAKERGSHHTEYAELKLKLDGIKRTSKQYIDGLTVAQTEYDRELKSRRDAEAEVTRLRILLSGQAARLTALSGDTRKHELRQQLSKQLNENLSGLEQDLSKLKVERDMTLAEVEELSATKSSGPSSIDTPPNNLSRSFTKRLDTIKNQYQRELIPLTQQRETLAREIAELKAVRDDCLEETTALNARNEELAQLTAVYARRMETIPESSKPINPTMSRGSLDRPRPQVHAAPSLSSSTSTLHDDSLDPRTIRAQKSDYDLHTPSKKFKWPGSKAKEAAHPISVSGSMENRAKTPIDHNFQQISVLRFTRCDHCGDTLWGSQLRCTACNISIHVRCSPHVSTPCAHHPGGRDDFHQQHHLPPSMFGRDLTEQVRSDAKGGHRKIPIIVEKCITAVEARALDYEGIYRKTGGSGQTKTITQFFERADYDSFDLTDADRFNDISSVTSVLKTYFRSLPVPLLTFELHEQFMSAAHLRDPPARNKALLDLVNRLPTEHYCTLRLLMMHLFHIRDRSEKNLMNARNLGVVFGPTLMRSRDPAAEFSDMAGKALSIEWLVDNAPLIFGHDGSG
ncbi:hypothetical protein BD779DRAFT_1669623 [Infundibulicybe gibba]|nr:hypothetical protein BD779DRAFT_1669623 [Infundibulicybe gibba]